MGSLCNRPKKKKKKATKNKQNKPDLLGAYFWSTGWREVLLMLTIKKVKVTINYFYCFIHTEFTEHDLYVNGNFKDSALCPLVMRNNV